MKRFTVATSADGEGCLVEHPEGEAILFEDVRAIISKLLDRANEELDDLPYYCMSCNNLTFDPMWSDVGEGTYAPTCRHCFSEVELAETIDDLI